MVMYYPEHINLQRCDSGYTPLHHAAYTDRLDIVDFLAAQVWIYYVHYIYMYIHPSVCIYIIIRMYMYIYNVYMYILYKYIVCDLFS